MSGHTPGPWHTCKGWDCGNPICDGIYSSDGVGVLSAALDEDTVQANARLIASSPELLEAAKKTEGVLYAALGEWLDDNNALPFNSLERLMDDVRAAIAKAEGRE